MNKKGYYFTLTVIIILGLVTAYYMSSNNPGHDKRVLVNQERLQEINSFLELAQLDATEALSITSKRAFLAFEQDYLRPRGEYIPPEDLDDLFEELIMSASIDGTPAVLLTDSTLTSWESEIKNLGAQYALDLDFIWGEPQLLQNDAWNVLVYIDYLLQANDTFSDASWNISGTVRSSVPVVGLYDPLYTIETHQKYFQIITPSNQTNNFDVLDHLVNHQYIQVRNSPSFLQRLVGDMTAPSHPLVGIESLADVPTLMDHGVDYTDRALSDWHYFGYGTYTKVCVHDTIWWIYVDKHLGSVYGLTDCDRGPPEGIEGPIRPIDDPSFG